MGASLMAPRPGQSPFDLSTLNLLPTPPPVAPLNTNRDKEAHLTKRVRELEEEVRTVRVENEKQVCSHIFLVVSSPAAAHTVPASRKR